MTGYRQVKCINRGKITLPAVRGGLAAMLLSFSLGLPPAAIAADEPLLDEINQLKHRLSSLEAGRGVAAPEEEGAAPWFDRVTLSGAIEVEGSIRRDDVTTESDIAVATLELGVDAEVSDYSSAHVHLLYEDDPGTLDVEEAMITLGNTAKFPLFLSAGKMYVPFGNYESHMLTDPYTLELGETNEGALQIGLEAGGFRTSVYAFNGDTSNGGDDKAQHYGASFGYGMERKDFRLDLGADWQRSIRDSDGLFDATGGVAPHDQGVNDYVPGVAAHLTVGAGPVTLIGEYVAALDDLYGAGSNSEVSAFNLEAGLTFQLGTMETFVAVGYQETDEADSIMPEQRLLASMAVAVMPGTTVHFEWMNEEDYQVNGGLDWDVYTLQLAVSF
jgi:hypothetical protein